MSIHVWQQTRWDFLINPNYQPIVSIWNCDSYKPVIVQKYTYMYKLQNEVCTVTVTILKNCMFLKYINYW